MSHPVKHTLWLVVAIIIVFFLGGVFLYWRASNVAVNQVMTLDVPAASSVAQPENSVTTSNQHDTPASSVEKTSPPIETNNLQNNQDAQIIDLQIREGSEVSYSVQKIFFNEPAQIVTGATSTILQTLQYNLDTKEISGQLKIDARDFDSGNNLRDQATSKLFARPVTVTVPATVLSGEIFSLQEQIVDVEITINSVTQTIPLLMIGGIEDQYLAIVGSTIIDMNEFGINPPSVEGVYTIDPMIGIEVSLIAHN